MQSCRRHSTPSRFSLTCSSGPTPSRTLPTFRRRAARWASSRVQPAHPDARRKSCCPPGPPRFSCSPPSPLPKRS
eukprot:94161-Prymnesium_polylepis.1